MKKVNIKKIVERLKKCKVEKVILFGSWAKGKANKYSDIDLLIIKKTRKNPYRRIPEIRKYLFDIDSAFDILVMTPKEVEHRLSLGDFL